MKLAAAAQMRELDRRAIQERKIPSIDLMNRAAEAVVGLRFGEIPPEEAQLDGMERYHQELERMVKRKTGRLAYFWRRGIPCVWGAVSGLLTKRSNF